MTLDTWYEVAAAIAVCGLCSILMLDSIARAISYFTGRKAKPTRPRRN